MKKSSGSVLSVLLVCTFAVLSMAGCSSNFTLPWEENLLDPSRIATREPLEIPPDLNLLPGTEPQEEMQAKGTGAKYQDTRQDDGQPTSARAILFKTPQAREEKPLSRDEQERLPSWLERSRGVK
ncbi:MAG: DUF3035 domain-containing protein [Magnetococcus sp. YQC-5]